MEFREIFLKQKDAIRRRTLEVLGSVRPEHLDWRPEKDALSVGEMLQHLWVSEEGVRRVALEANFAYYETRVSPLIFGSWARRCPTSPSPIDRSRRRTESSALGTPEAAANRFQPSTVDCAKTRLS